MSDTFWSYLNRAIELCSHPATQWVLIGLSILMGWIQPALAMLTMLGCYLFQVQLGHAAWVLSLVSLLPLLWPMVRTRVLHVPPAHYALVQSGQTSRVLTEGLHLLWPWEWVDTRFTGGCFFCTRDTVFVYELAIYDDAIDRIYVSFILTKECDPCQILRLLRTDMTIACPRARAMGHVLLDTPSLVANNKTIYDGLALPPYLVSRGINVDTKVKVVVHQPPAAEPTAPRGRRQSVGARK